MISSYIYTDGNVHQHDAFSTVWFPHIRWFFIRVSVARAVKTIVVGKAYAIMHWVNVAASMDLQVIIILLWIFVVSFLLKHLLSLK